MSMLKAPRKTPFKPMPKPITVSDKEETPLLKPTTPTGNYLSLVDDDDEIFTLDYEQAQTPLTDAEIKKAIEESIDLKYEEGEEIAAALAESRRECPKKILPAAEPVSRKRTRAQPVASTSKRQKKPELLQVDHDLLTAAVPQYAVSSESRLALLLARFPGLETVPHQFNEETLEVTFNLSASEELLTRYNNSSKTNNKRLPLPTLRLVESGSCGALVSNKKKSIWETFERNFSTASLMFCASCDMCARNFFEVTPNPLGFRCFIIRVAGSSTVNLLSSGFVDSSNFDEVRVRRAVDTHFVVCKDCFARRFSACSVCNESIRTDSILCHEK